MNGPDDMAASVPICSAINTGFHKGTRNRQPIGRSVHSARMRPSMGTFCTYPAGPVEWWSPSVNVSRPARSAACAWLSTVSGPCPLAARFVGRKGGSDGYADTHHLPVLQEAGHPATSVRTRGRSRRGSVRAGPIRSRGRASGTRGARGWCAAARRRGRSRTWDPSAGGWPPTPRRPRRRPGTGAHPGRAAGSPPPTRSGRRAGRWRRSATSGRWTLV